MTDVVTGSLQVDLKRRTTLPGDILAAAGIPAGSALVARVEEPGRIVLESPALLLSQLQDDIAAALAGPREADADGGSVGGGRPEDTGKTDRPTRDLVAELLAERAADASLEQHKPGGREEPGERGAESTSPTDDGTSASGGEHATSGAPSSDLPDPRDGDA